MSKLVRSSDFNELHLVNMPAILITDEVLNLSNFNDFNSSQPLNISVI